MTNQTESKHHLDNELGSMRQQIEHLEQALMTQKEIAFAAGIFQTDVTVRTLLESLAEGVIICDKTGKIILINRRAEELFGYTPDEVIGHSLNIFLPERFFNVHPQHIDAYFENPFRRPMGHQMDLSGKRKDGTEIPVEVSLSFLTTEVGTLGLAFVTDISERKQAEWALKLKNEELDAFAHTVAHNLKASLATLIGYSEVLADIHRTLTEQEQHDYIMALARNGRRMSNIIDELLVFASIRKEDVAKRPLDMHSIIDKSLQRLHFMLKEYEAELILPEMFHEAVGYGPWVEEVWYNYLTNAIKYGGRPPRIEIGSDLLDGSVKYWVKDNGPGISEQDMALLFTQYARLETPKIEGHGLGLSIVKKIVQKLDGDVGVESELGEGTLFSFTLPAVSSD